MTTDVKQKALPVFAKARALLGKLGMRPYTAYLRRITPNEARGGLGATETIVDTLLTEKPRIRAATSRDIVSSGGRISAGDYIMDRITPQNQAGTVGIAFNAIDIKPQAPGQKVFVVLVGTDMPPYVVGPPPSGGGEFDMADRDAAKNFEFSFVLTPRTGRR